MRHEEREARRDLAGREPDIAAQLKERWAAEKDKEEKRKPDPKEPFCGLVFKASWHPNGNRFFVRVYSGTMRPNMRAYNPGKDVKENIAKLFHVQRSWAAYVRRVSCGNRSAR